MYQIQTQAELLGSAKCVQGKEGNMVCISQNCAENGFVCSDPQCQCTKKSHYYCSYVKYTNLIQRINKKRLRNNVQFNKFCDEINAIYEQVIEKASQERQKFYEWKDYAGLNRQQSQLLKKIEKQQLNNINGKFLSTIMSNLEKNSNYIIKDKDYLKHEWKLKNDKLSPIWVELEELYLRNVNFYSTITNDIGSIQSLFDKKICNFRLLYRASTNKYSTSQFHRACDGETDTITLIKSKNGKSIGFFTSLPWVSSTEGVWMKQKNTTFSFCLESKRKELQDGIYCKSDLGPVFSSGTDIILYEKIDRESFELPRSYGNRHFCLYTSKVLEGNKKQIEVIEWEIFKVNWVTS